MHDASVSPVSPVSPVALESAEFKRWFQDSKVVDSAGRPLVLYHGTDADFTCFETGDVGFHFGTLSAAHNRLDHTRDDRSRGAQERLTGAEHLMPVYLSIKNPLRMPDAGDWDNPDIVANYVSDLIIEDDEFERAYIAAADAIGGDDFRAIFEHMGYDGIVYANVAEGGGDSFIAFRAGQVKSAIGNSGLYDRANPDITDRIAGAGAARDYLSSIESMKASPHA